MSEAEKLILKTIVYYNCLDYPLTFEEIENFSFISGEKGIEGIEENLRNLVRKELIKEDSGFYFLKGRDGLVEIRKGRNKLAKDKWKKALKAIKWLRAIPYVRLVFGSGSLTLGNTDKNSDLDVLIVVRHGRIWTTRFLTAVLLGFLGIRRKRYEKLAPDKICLNHFITDNSLRIPRKSIYTAQLYARLAPIFAEDEEIIDKFCKANSWVGNYISGWPECVKQNPNDKIQMTNKFQIPNSKLPNSIKKIIEKILDTKLGDWFERILRNYQLRRINNFHLTHKPGGRVKADDESLEFHPDSPELKIIERYNRSMIRLGFPELANETNSGLTEKSQSAK